MRFDPTQVDNLVEKERKLLSDDRSLALWREWIRQYSKVAGVQIEFPPLAEVADIYERYRSEDPHYIETRTYLGHLSVHSDWEYLLGALIPFADFLGCAIRLPVFLVYPSCIESRDIVSLLFPFAGATEKKYLGHVSVGMELLKSGGINCYTDLRDFLRQHPSGPWESVYYDNKRPDILPRVKGKTRICAGS